MSVLNAASIFLLVVFVVGCTMEGSTVVPPTQYREEPYILSDGTPCVIIRGGTHSRMVGVTCNYHHDK